MPTGDPGPVIRAAQVVLDRTGFHPSAHVDVTRSMGMPVAEYMAWIPHEQLTVMVRWLRDARERMARGEPRCDGQGTTVPKPVEGSVIVEADCRWAGPGGE